MQGKIIGNISNVYKIKTESKEYNAYARGKLKNNEITPLVGDNVEIQVTDEEKSEAIIEKVEQRKNEIKRPKISNIDQIIFVISTKHPKPDLLMLDKQLAYAEKLGIKLYDKEFIEKVAEKTGFSEEYIESNEQKRDALAVLNNGFYSEFNNSDELFIEESKLIKEVAEKESCVIIGRCADFILKDMENVIKVFIHSNMEDKIKRATEIYGLDKAKAEKEIKRIGIARADLLKTEYIEPMLDRYKYKNIEEMYAAVGFGANSPVKIIARVLQEYRKEHQEINVEEKIQELSKDQKDRKARAAAASSGVVVKGIDNCLVKLSKCCNPLPGDEIVGYITKGRGVSVHRKDCVNVKDLLTEENRMIDVEWYKEAKESYQVEIEVLANDRSGLLVDILNVLKDTKAKLMGVNTRTTKERIAIMDISIEIDNLEELNKVQKVIRKVDSVYEVRRKR